MCGGILRSVFKHAQIANTSFLRRSYYRFELLFDALRAIVVVLVLTTDWGQVHAGQERIAGYRVFRFGVASDESRDGPWSFVLGAWSVLGSRSRGPHLRPVTGDQEPKGLRPDEGLPGAQELRTIGYTEVEYALVAEPAR